MEAAARTAGRIGTDPGDRFMTRHAMNQLPATGVQPPATDPRVSMVITDADRATSDCARSLQGRAKRQRSTLAVSISALPDYVLATADISRNPKSP